MVTTIWVTQTGEVLIIFFNVIMQGMHILKRGNTSSKKGSKLVLPYLLIKSIANVRCA